MLSLFYNFRNNRYSLIKISDIITNYNFPFDKDFIKNNKTKNNSIENTIIENTIENLDKKIMIKFNPITPIYFTVYKNKRYVIDGIHRLECYKKNKYLHNHKIPIIDIYINEKKEIYEYYKLINNIN